MVVVSKVDPFAGCLDRELKTWSLLKPGLLVQHPGKWVLIKGSELVGVYDSCDEAIRDSYVRFWIDVPVLVRRVQQEEPTWL